VDTVVGMGLRLKKFRMSLKREVVDDPVDFMIGFNPIIGVGGIQG
jgi:hypothetical protein